MSTTFNLSLLRDDLSVLGVNNFLSFCSLTFSYTADDYTDLDHIPHLVEVKQSFFLHTEAIPCVWLRLTSFPIPLPFVFWLSSDEERHSKIIPTVGVLQKHHDVIFTRNCQLRAYHCLQSLNYFSPSWCITWKGPSAPLLRQTLRCFTPPANFTRLHPLPFRHQAAQTPVGLSWWTPFLTKTEL